MHEIPIKQYPKALTVISDKHFAPAITAKQRFYDGVGQLISKASHASIVHAVLDQTLRLLLQ